MFSQEKREQIGRTLQQKGVTAPCEKCSHEQFIVLDGYFQYPAQSDLKSIDLQSPGVPTVGVACQNCGHVSFFAAKIIVPQDFE